MMQRVVIGSLERGLLLKNKQLQGILTPGVRFVPSRWLPVVGSQRVIVVDISSSLEVTGVAAEYVKSSPAAVVGDSLLRITAGPREVVVVCAAGKAIALVTPSQERVFWKGYRELSTRRFDITNEAEIPSEIVKDLSLLSGEEGFMRVQVPEQQVGVLRDGGVIVRILEAGTYGFWRPLRALSVEVVDLRLAALEVSGQEMLTKDKVSLRLNLTLSYRVADLLMALRSTSDLRGDVYRMSQLALRQAVGEKTLDQLLEEKDALNSAVRSEVSAALQSLGIEVAAVGVKDIILPGDMRALFNQVVEAEKAAQAQNIRRREETAATRSLLNTAKMMENNPILLRMKELEALERISEKVDKLTVYDGLQGIMKGLVSLNGLGDGSES